MRPWILLVTLCVPAALASGPDLSLELRARAVAPGEPVRVVAHAREPLERLEGEFLGRPLFMSREDGDATSWSGWTLVGLDDAAGPTRLELHGTTAAGRAVSASRSVEVEARSFPREELKVAPKYVSPPPEVEERLARERVKLDAIYRARRENASAAVAFQRPVPGERTSVFGMRRFYNGEPRSPHPGVDLRAASGTPVHAAGDGVVVLAEDLYYSGNTVILDHGGGLFTIYAHLSEVRVHEGQSTRAGALLGLSGATGRVTGPHLHWGAKIGDVPFDPAALLDPELFR